MTIALSIICGILCFLGGGFFGVIPLREEQQTVQQKTLSRTMSIVVLGIVIILILLGEDVASWIAIAAALVGFGAGKIPPLQAFFTTRWKVFRGKNARTQSPRKTKKRNSR